MTHKFEMIGGKMQQPGRNVLAAAITGLPDGEYVVHIQSVGDVAARIEEIIEWYQGLDDLQMNDPGLLLYLNPFSQKLLLLLDKYSKLVTLAKKTRDGLKLAIEIQRRVKLDYARRQTEEQKAKFVASAALIEIEAELCDLYKGHFEAEQLYNLHKALFDSWDKIYERMRSQISLLKGFNERG